MARGTPMAKYPGIHGYSGIPGIYYSNAMARGTPMAKSPGILWILWHSRDIL